MVSLQLYMAMEVVLKVDSVEGCDIKTPSGVVIDLHARSCYFIKGILPSLHNRTHSKVEAWARWSARPKICLIVTMGLQQSG